MDSIDPENVKKMIKDAVREMRLSFPKDTETPGRETGNKGPKVLIVFHAGLSKLDEAMIQVRLIQELAGKSSVFTDESVRGRVCGDDVRKQAGTRCILDTVRPDGLEKVLERADVLVLPTFCLKVGAKVANLVCDDHGSGIVFSALAWGKKILASRDGFLINKTLSNPKIREEIDRIMKKLEDYGVIFSPTDQLGTMFRQIALVSRKPGDHEGKKDRNSGDALSLRIVTARDINKAANDKKNSIRVAAGGVITPLAGDLAKEYGIKIIRG